MMFRARSVLIPALAVWVLMGLLLPGQASSQLALDSDLGPGYRGGSVAEGTGTVSFEVFGSGLESANGYSATLAYDSAALTFKSFKASSLIPDFTGLVIRGDGTVEIGGASMNGVAAAGRGQLGVVTFTVASDFSGTSSVSLGSGSLSASGASSSFTGSSTVVVGGVPEDVIVLDAGLTAGYQGGRRVEPVAVGEEVTLELYATELTGANAFSAALVFDASELELTAFRTGVLIPGLVGLVDSEDAGTVQVGGGATEGVATASSGRLGTVVFTVLPGFDGSADITLQGGVISKADGMETLTTGTMVTLVGDVAGPATRDYDGDGRVDFDDFLAFVAAFGKSQGQAGYEARFDLNSSGRVDFNDFLLFVADFGKSV